MNRSNIDGVIGKSFTIGYGKGAVTFSINDEGNLEIAAGIIPAGNLDMGEHKITASFEPKEKEDLVNLAAMTEAIAAADAALKKFVNDTVKDITGGTTGTNVMMAPLEITGDELANGYSVEIGTLTATKYIDRVIFEVLEAFTKTDGLNYFLSIGTATQPEALVPKFSIDKLTSTYVINVCKTIAADTCYMLYVTAEQPEVEDPPVDPVVPDDFEQAVYNNQIAVTAALDSDASKKVWTITLTGEELIGNIDDTELFGDISGNVMDFSINVPVIAGHTYRIVQQNPALAYYPDDPYIQNVAGVWTKDKEYEATADDTEFIYSFVVTQSAGDNDYIHIYLYDLDGDTPDNAIRSYHIKNELKFDGTSSPVSPLQIDFASASEGSAGIVQNADGQFTITLTGEVHSLTADALRTDLGIYYPKMVGTDGIRVAVYNPENAQYYGMDDAVAVTDGVYYSDITAFDTDEIEGLWIDIPVGVDQSHPIVLAVIDLATKDYFLVGIDNQLTILPMDTADANGSEETNEDANTEVTAFNLLADESVPVTQAEGDTGAAILRILSF